LVLGEVGGSEGWGRVPIAPRATPYHEKTVIPSLRGAHVQGHGNAAHPGIPRRTSEGHLAYALLGHPAIIEPLKESMKL